MLFLLNILLRHYLCRKEIEMSNSNQEPGESNKSDEDKDGIGCFEDDGNKETGRGGLGKRHYLRVVR